MILLFIFSTTPVPPPPKPPVELRLFKEALPGKEIEIVDVDENGEEYLPFVLIPEPLRVKVADVMSGEKSPRVHRRSENTQVKSRVSASKYNRRGTRNK